MTEYVVTDEPKQLRETLCVAQALIGNSEFNQDRKQSHMWVLQRLIDECDRHRPLGTGGKHGELHTPTCGCAYEDYGTFEERIVDAVSNWDEE